MACPERLERQAGWCGMNNLLEKHS